MRGKKPVLKALAGRKTVTIFWSACSGCQLVGASHAVCGKADATGRSAQANPFQGGRRVSLLSSPGIEVTRLIQLTTLLLGKLGRLFGDFLIDVYVHQLGDS